MAKKKYLRDLREMDIDNSVIEPYCGHCRVGTDGKTYCGCGWTLNERLASAWKLDGTNPKPGAA